MKIRCPKCKARVEVLAEQACLTIQCGECGTKMRMLVPAAEPTPALWNAILTELDNRRPHPSRGGRRWRILAGILAALLFVGGVILGMASLASR
jgi:hypothetical protein